ncbi:hypothetical protein ILYODFUR_013672 [Ilyodon furcidens]|uniref:Uncharacterized protein n=1 Tax=Ilyodon furcidens TaxID=33524 RepID=A0ABV0V3S7_9TELE
MHILEAEILKITEWWRHLKERIDISITITYPLDIMHPQFTLNLPPHGLKISFAAVIPRMMEGGSFSPNDLQLVLEIVPHGFIPSNTLVSHHLSYTVNLLVFGRLFPH